MVRKRKQNDGKLDPFGHIEHHRKRAVLAAYAESGGQIVKACRVAGIPRNTEWYWRQTDAEYKETLETIAHPMACDTLESELARRSCQGVDRRKLYRGEQVYVAKLDESGQPIKDTNGEPVMVPYIEQEASDTLLMFSLKAQKPEKYGDKVTHRHEGVGRVAGKGRDDVKVEIADRLRQMGQAVSPN